MSENDFKAAFPPEESKDNQGAVKPTRIAAPNIQAGMSGDVPSEPIEPPATVDPPEAPWPGQQRGANQTSGIIGDASLARSEPSQSGGDTGSGSDRGEEIKTEARELAQDGKDSALHVGETAKREAGEVINEVKTQTTNLLDDLGSDVRAQAATMQEKVSENLRQISEELRGMLNSSESSGTASSLVDQAARHSGHAADWLQAREPGELLDEVKGFARRRPGAFLGIALGAGLLAGRIARNAKGQDPSTKDTKPSTAAQEQGTPRTARPLPPTVNETIGSGGVGGTGLNPGTAHDPTMLPGNNQGFPRS